MSRPLQMSSILAAAGLAMSTLAPAVAATDPAAPAAQAPGHRTAKGVGVVTEIDAGQAMVTLKHEPIPALGWPSMVMPFRVTSPALLNGLKVGEKVAFDTREADGLPEITAIRKR